MVAPFLLLVPARLIPTPPSFPLPYYPPIATMPPNFPVVQLGAVPSSSPILLPITPRRLSIHPLSLCWPPGYCCCSSHDPPHEQLLMRLKVVCRTPSRS